MKFLFRGDTEIDQYRAEWKKYADRIKQQRAPALQQPKPNSRAGSRPKPILVWTNPNPPMDGGPPPYAA